MDGAAGSFVIAPTDKTGDDLRGKGQLQYVGATTTSASPRRVSIF